MMLGKRNSFLWC